MTNNRASSRPGGFLFQPDYFGFMLSETFVVGYGLDARVSGKPAFL
jgi:hypoxanthine-guanine phosphoribosyltransferase